MIQIFRDNEMGAAHIKVWQKCFKDGQGSVESDPCSGKAAVSTTPDNVKHVRAAVTKDR